jgi:hypothetical protein
MAIVVLSAFGISFNSMARAWSNAVSGLFLLNPSALSADPTIFFSQTGHHGLLLSLVVYVALQKLHVNVYVVAEVELLLLLLLLLPCVAIVEICAQSANS